MVERSRVAVLKVRPETLGDDLFRLCELAGMKDALKRFVHSPVVNLFTAASASGAHHAPRAIA